MGSYGCGRGWRWRLPPVLLAFVPAASAAPAPTAADPRRAQLSRSAAGGKAKLVATLTSAGKPLAGKSVSFFTGATDLGKAKTDSKGRASRNVKLTAPASYVARFTPAGADAAAYTAGQSPAVTLAPAARVTGRPSTAICTRAGGRRDPELAGAGQWLGGAVRRGSRSRGLDLPGPAASPARDPPRERIARRPREVRPLDQAFQARRVPREREPGRRRGRQRAALRGARRARTTARAAWGARAPAPPQGPRLPRRR